MSVSVKRIYEKPARVDGKRVLVDRLWPRGISKDAAALDAWLAFRKRYLKELRRPEASGDLDQLYKLAHESKRLTLLFASKNEDRNNAIVLKDLLDGMRKPPTGTGPGAVRAMPDRTA